MALGFHSQSYNAVVEHSVTAKGWWRRTVNIRWRVEAGQ